MKETKRIAHLIFLSLFHLADESEQAELDGWFAKKDKNRVLFHRLQDAGILQSRLSEYGGYNVSEAWRKVEKSIATGRRRRVLRFLPYAAVLVLGIGIWTAVRLASFQEDADMPQGGVALSGSQVCLMTEDGEVMELGGAGQKDSVLRIGGNELLNRGGQLTYGHKKTAVSRRHTLRVPRGAEFSLVLADGTRVWLNAETELNYPDCFVGDVRRVRVKGEAYFEVTRDTAMPFIVETDKLQINVLGTSFNVSAYPGEEQHTTLVEGKVTAGYAGEEKSLLPGEQVVLASGGMVVKKVDVTEYTAWMERRFVFRNKPLPDIAKQLERWYDIRFVIRPEAGDIRLTANLPKYGDITKVLGIIEDIAGVHCQDNGKEIVITKE